jgi:putative hemolysin
MVFVVLGLLFVLTALLTAAEMATFSARPERMRQCAESGDRRGTLVLAYQRSPVSFLSAGQVLATAAAFVTGALIQSHIAPPIIAWLGTFLHWTVPQLEALGSTVALILMTIVALILTNVVPKQIGFDHADKVAIFFSSPFRLLIRLTRPIAWLVTVTSQVFERAVNRRNRLGARVTEADLLTLLAEGIRIGALDHREARFVRHALRLSDLTMKDVMTPIDQVEAIDALWPMNRIIEAVHASDHSFLPVFEGDLDHPMGVLKARTWLAVQDSRPKLESVLMPLVVLRAEDSAVQLFEVLKDKESRMLFVQSKEGKTIGMVTLNDAIQLLTGDLESIAS